MTDKVKSLYLNESYICKILNCFGKSSEIDNKSEKFKKIKR